MKQSYVIITPAFNEAAYISKTIESVLTQSVLPKLWIIVDDGSTDGTGEIIKKYAAHFSWIKYIYRFRIPSQTYYCSNVYAIMAGYEQVKATEFNFIAVLDADISLPSDYYAQVLERMEDDCKLGIASGVYVDNVNGKLRKVLNDRRSTPKALMVFRKNCYKEIGGFIPLKYGYEDTCVCFMARMKGWKTWSYPELVVIHNKPVGMGHSRNLLGIRFRLGIGEYFSGSHPVFMILKAIKRCFMEPPFILGGIARLLGYSYGFFMREKRQIPKELVKFIRKEQLLRILKLNCVSGLTLHGTEK